MSCDNSSSSANPTTTFPNAAQMGLLSSNLPVVWKEICAIQQQILEASSQCQPGGGKMCVTVGGTTPMTFVSGVESITVTNGGSGYETDEPHLIVVPPVGSLGAGAELDIVTNGGSILSVSVTNAGSGYQPISATMSVSSVAGLGAVLEPLVDGSGKIVYVNIADGGSGYTVDDTVTASRAVLPNPAYVNAVFKITSVGITGEILEVAILNSGSGYQPSVATVQVVSSLNNLLPYPLGTGFSATVITDVLGAVTQVIVTNTGVGYANFPPYLVISNPGTGAETQVTESGGSITSITVTESGSEYVLPISGTVFNPPTAGLPNPPVTPAVVAINIAENTYGTDPNLYWQVWAGTTTDKSIQSQLNQVLSYFKGLGYTIDIRSNPQTGSTIVWQICW